jgi:hypothetical protein
MQSRSANDLTKIKIPLDDLQPSHLFVSQRLEAKLPDFDSKIYSNSPERTLKLEDFETIQNKDLPGFFSELNLNEDKSSYSVADEILENCRKTRDEIEVAVSTRINEVLRVKKLLLKQLNDYENKRIKKFASKSGFQFMESVEVPLNKCSTPSASMYNIGEYSSQESIFVDESCINDELIKFNMNKNVVDEMLIGELVIESITQPIVYDVKSFVKCSLAKLFDQDAQPDKDFEIEIQNGSYYALYLNQTNYESVYVSWNKKIGHVVLLNVPNKLAIISHKQKNDLLVLNYIEQKRQAYYLRVIRITENVKKPVEYLKLIRADDKDLEKLFLIGANNEYIFCSSPSGIHILDWNLSIIKTFGQEKDINEPFYFGDIIKQIELKQNKYYWLNENSLNITNSNDGILLKSIKIKADKFFFDSKDCLIVFSESSQTVWFITIDGKIECKSRLVQFPSKISSIYIDDNHNISFFDKKSLELYMYMFNNEEF